jgi:AcrR family transcriptional regulator
MPSAKGRPKGDKRARTRAALVQAALQVIRDKGFERTTLEDVARAAGMTRGAIYGNFSSREDLFIAVLEARWEPIVPPFKPGGSFAEQMRILGEAVVAALPARRAAAVGAASFQLYALTHEDMRSRVAALNAELYRQAAEGVLAFLPESELPMPSGTFVKVLHGLMDGLVLLASLTPELVDEETVRAAFDALARTGRG